VISVTRDQRHQKDFHLVNPPLKELLFDSTESFEELIK
jgi:hypothetical protein